jgi:cation transport ATPase
MVGDEHQRHSRHAQADSGIGMGTGTELNEAGDAILLHSDLAPWWPL